MKFARLSRIKVDSVPFSLKSKQTLAAKKTTWLKLKRIRQNLKLVAMLSSIMNLLVKVNLFVPKSGLFGAGKILMLKPSLLCNFFAILAAKTRP